MTVVIEDLEDWYQTRRGPAFSKGTIGFVPTMGNLHGGHSSLLTQCRLDNDISVLSIFVNKPQFNDLQDLETYPRTFDSDLEIAEEKGVDYLLYPSYQQIYADSYTYRVSESVLSQRLCGKHRPGHFDAVLTVVLKLILLVQPHRGYFGEKDFQQLKLVEGMVEAFFLDTQIVACPTVRDEDGLAWSSRNRKLTPTQRKLAAEFPRLLQQQPTVAKAAEELRRAGFEVDYVEEIMGRRFGAVRLGSIRLIDNFPLERIPKRSE
jgi:pantoate--beta-alanine ligase